MSRNDFITCGPCTRLSGSDVVAVRHAPPECSTGEAPPPGQMRIAAKKRHADDAASLERENAELRNQLEDERAADQETQSTISRSEDEFAELRAVVRALQHEKDEHREARQAAEARLEAAEHRNRRILDSMRQLGMENAELRRTVAALHGNTCICVFCESTRKAAAKEPAGV